MERREFDYKDHLQEQADNLSWAIYDRDFYDLPDDKQDEIYCKVLKVWEEGELEERG